MFDVGPGRNHASNVARHPPHRSEEEHSMKLMLWSRLNYLVSFVYLAYLVACYIVASYTLA